MPRWSTNYATRYNNPKSGVKYWSPRSVPVITAYSVSPDRSGVRRAYDGRQAACQDVRGIRQGDVPKYLKALVGHFGRTAIIMDNAPQHKARIVRESWRASQTRGSCDFSGQRRNSAWSGSTGTSQSATCWSANITQWWCTCAVHCQSILERHAPNLTQ